MPDTATPREVFHRLVDGVTRLVAGDRTQVDRLADLYAGDTHVSHPFLGDPPLRGREEVRRHFAAVPATGRPGFRVEDVHVHETTDPQVVVAEFAYAGDGFRYRCVFVIRVRDGLIVESRDYIDHLRSARATGRLDDLLSRIG